MIKKILNYFEKPYTAWLPRNDKKQLKKIDSIDVDLVSHCNLKCKGCSHFSPIAKPTFLSTEKYETDIIQLRKIVSAEQLGVLFLIGGEPLLHPQIIDFMKISRNVYQNTPIVIITNGFLLLKQSQLFWETCKSLKIKIEITKYPVPFDYNPIFKKANQENVELVFKGRTKFYKKKQYYLPLDLQGSRIAAESYKHCFMARHCFNLSDGKLFPCSYAACIGRFNEHFNQHIPIEEGDYINIYQCENFDELAQKLNGPYPMCKYCAVDKRVYGNDWSVSKGDINEWII